MQNVCFVSYQGALLKQTSTWWIHDETDHKHFLFYIYLKACNINDIKTICCLE